MTFKGTKTPFSVGDKVIHIEYSQSGVITTEADWLKSNLVYIKYHSIEDVYFIKWDNGGYTTAFGKTHAENALRILTPLEEAML